MHKCSPPFKDQNAHVASVKNILGSHASYLMSGKELSKIVAFVKGTQFDLLEFLQRERYGSAHLDNFASGLELIGQKGSHHNDLDDDFGRIYHVYVCRLYFSLDENRICDGRFSIFFK
ncbi:uncharacterized protein LOC141667522 [Apium graveolens]|uniref:uncharacterized protein LOC141664208 n=1 Tax=Apium graveolens TaxID=4045 RepID=UPI003D797C2F